MNVFGTFSALRNILDFPDILLHDQTETWCPLQAPAAAYQNQLVSCDITE